MRLEFFGDELESMRFFDPLTQVSREEISSVKIPPAGELGLLKRRLRRDSDTNARGSTPERFGSLLDYLAPETVMFCANRPILKRNERNTNVRSPDPTHCSFVGRS